MILFDFSRKQCYSDRGRFLGKRAFEVKGENCEHDWSCQMV